MDIGNDHQWLLANRRQQAIMRPIIKQHTNNYKDLLPKISNRESDLASMSNFIGNNGMGGEAKIHVNDTSGVQ